MPASVTFEDKDMGMQRVLDEINEQGGYVDTGVQSDEGDELLIIAAANEFGATIKHPGGTSFGFRTKKDAASGKVRFLKKGKGFMEIGKTNAHEIKIPARPYIRGAIDANEVEIQELAKRYSGEILDGTTSRHEALTLMGQFIEGEIKRYMINLRTPPNAKSTIRKKGSDNPLVDTGLLMGSIRYVVKSGEAEDSDGVIA